MKEKHTYMVKEKAHLIIKKYIRKANLYQKEPIIIL